MGRANGEAGRLDRELVRVAWVTHSKGVTQQGTQADRNMRTPDLQLHLSPQLPAIHKQTGHC
jgi:hypothetical protein